MADQPYRGGRGLVKEQEDAAQKAFDRTALAQFVLGPGGRQAGAVLLPLGIPGNDGGGMQGSVDPTDEAQAPIGGIQADEARADLIEMHRPFQERTGKGSIMDEGRAKAERKGASPSRDRAGYAHDSRLTRERGCWAGA